MQSRLFFLERRVPPDMGEDQDRHGFGSGPKRGAAIHGPWGYDRGIPRVPEGATLYIRQQGKIPKHGVSKS